MDDKSLIKEAFLAREAAYAPYSGFTVGAALLTAEGEVYRGCNIENATYGATNCAERTAVFKAVSEGVADFTAIAIAGGIKGEKPVDYCYPCGICRQVLAEFDKNGALRIICAKSEEDYKVYSLKDLLPECFSL
ncbi:MAG: cytidine deaminase [Lachnospiraceae bacterium]|nr:cytidine deaminase [Lachnospiraceae bacterium]